MRHTPPSLLFVAILPACAGNGDTASARNLQITVIEPAVDVVVAPGDSVTVAATVDGVQGRPQLDFLADADGDLTTTADQVEIAGAQTANASGATSAQWDTTGVASNSYAILVRRTGTDDAGVRALGRVTVNVWPGLSITTPAADTIVSRGGHVSLAYSDNDPDDQATTQLFADGDGDLSTARDQYPLTDPRPEQNGAVQLVVRDLAGVPEAEYTVAGVITDAVHQPVQAVGPGKLRIANLAWAARAGDAGCEVGAGVAALADGSCVVTGRFADTATFGEGSPNQTVLTAAGDYDVFVARYASDGALMWAKRAGGPSGDLSSGAAALADSGCLVTGWFAGTAVFGAGEANQTALTTAGGNDMFVARYAGDGSLVWARRAGGTTGDLGRAVAALAGGGCVVTGQFSGTATFGAGEQHETVLGAAGGEDVFVAEYASDGSLVWAKSAGGVASEPSAGIAAFADGSCAVTGWFAGTATFGAGEPNQTVLTSIGVEDVFVARYTSDGSLAWAKSTRGTSGKQSAGIAAFADGSCAVAGHFFGAATFGAGEPNETILTSSADTLDVFVSRYAPDGALVWAKAAGGTSTERGAAIAVLADGSCLVTGAFEAIATFGAGEANETTLTSAGEADVFVARYGGDGALAWAKRAGGTEADLSGGISAHGDGSCVVTGVFSGAATFGVGEERQTTLEAEGDDVFIARFNADGGF